MPRRLIPLLTLISLLSACQHHHPAARLHLPIPPATIALPLLNPDPLTPQQSEKIQSLLLSWFPNHPPIWFILIFQNNTADDPHFSVCVYFIPDKQTTIHGPDPETALISPTLRQGRCFYIAYSSNPDGATLYGVADYIQVPDLALAPNPVLIPTLAELPIPKPLDIPDAEAAHLIINARAAYATHNIDPNTPIVEIDRSEHIPNRFQIQIGQRASEDDTQGVTLIINHYNHYYAVDPETTPWPEPTPQQNP